MNPEITWSMVHHIEDAAQRMSSAAERMEAAAKRIAYLLEDGYGGNGLRLIELLESAETDKTGDAREVV